MLLQQIERCLITSFAIGHDIADDYLRPQQRRAVISGQLKGLFRDAICGGVNSDCDGPGVRIPPKSKIDFRPVLGTNDAI